MKDNIVFTDGASRGNPGPGGWGAVIAADGVVTELGGREDHTTNNRMELSGAIGALEKLADIAEEYGSDEDYISGLGGGKQKTIIHTDSRYVINGVSKWLAGWQVGGWRTKAKTDVLNRDLWERLAKILEKIEQNFIIKWQYVGGHVGIPGNERVDVIATEYADGKKAALYNGPQANYPIDLSVTEGSPAAKDSKKKKKSDKPAYSYVSLVNGKVETHKTWAECEKRVKGASKAKFQKVFSAGEEAALIDSYKTL